MSPHLPRITPSLSTTAVTGHPMSPHRHKRFQISTITRRPAKVDDSTGRANEVMTEVMVDDLVEYLAYAAQCIRDLRTLRT